MFGRPGRIVVSDWDLVTRRLIWLFTVVLTELSLELGSESVAPGGGSMCEDAVTDDAEGAPNRPVTVSVSTPRCGRLTAEPATWPSDTLSAPGQAAPAAAEQLAATCVAAAAASR
ncbi:hypothetical protein GCM10009759_58980 [Kitasatospora saccharophila]|uniref:Secreted protein n=1 Tax=Kitasatospora saccharophila TaxID=407973 RepID=A0ABP5JC49_9ACTN